MRMVHHGGRRKGFEKIGTTVTTASVTGANGLATRSVTLDNHAGTWVATLLAFSALASLSPSPPTICPSADHPNTSNTYQHSQTSKALTFVLSTNRKHQSRMEQEKRLLRKKLQDRIARDRTNQKLGIPYLPSRETVATPSSRADLPPARPFATRAQPVQGRVVQKFPFPKPKPRTETSSHPASPTPSSQKRPLHIPIPNLFHRLQKQQAPFGRTTHSHEDAVVKEKLSLPSASDGSSRKRSPNPRMAALARELQETTNKLRLLQSMLDDKTRQKNRVLADEREALRVQDSIRVYKQDIKEAEAKQDRLLQALQSPIEPHHEGTVDLTMDDDP
ncbi:hypothetical protein EIP91_005788 [Steccherinum ochraceum]|uniref:Uncharacterized protein n=1 Tax=Steccherinum ochraceum TaxID=92696 RepID=A0A4V2MVN0_9APHY|nr:hypothetical protein EIP91_005788 [Steccherinum ochraceum]